MAVHESIVALLNSKNIPFRSIQHEPTFTSEESAKARGEDIKIGGKALLMKIDDQFILFVISAVLKTDAKKIKQRFNAKSIRFATKEELFDLTGLVPGSIPPFGRPILPFDLFIDDSIVHNEKIAFNAGSLTDSIILRTADYLSVASAEQFLFSQQ